MSRSREVDDGFERLLREQLDSELADVHADRAVLAEVLATPVRRRWWQLAPGGPAWLALAAAAVLVVAVVLVVPLLRPADGPDRLSTTPTPTAPATPTATSAPTPPPVQSPTSAPVLPPPAAPSPAAAACAPQTSDAGDTAVQVDLDGDGVPDALTWNGGALRVVLGAGRGELSSPFTTASPYISALPVSTDGTAGKQVLIGTRGAVGSQGSVGQLARLYDLRGCTFAPVIGVNGKPYDFEIGPASDTERSGVTCESGVLYGLTSVLKDGVWQVTETPVSTRTGTAVNGTPRHSTVPAGTTESELLKREHCDGDPQPLQ